jgi:endoglucanase
MNMRKIRTIYSLVLVAALLFTAVLPVIAAKEEALLLSGTHQLQDLPLFKDHIPGGWSGGDNCLEVTSDSQLPIDKEQMYNDLPSLRINVTRDGGWWTAIIAGPGWDTYNLETYYENGNLEFNIKGAVGNETFMLSMKDRYEKGKDVNISSFVTVNTEWQHVSIPLKSLIDPSVYALYSASQINFGKDYGSGSPVFTVWINDIKVTSPDSEKIFPEVKVNQLGYLEKSEKYALVSGFPDVLAANAGTPFEVRNAADHKVAYTGELSLVTSLDARVSGEKVLKADFSTLEVPGSYYISVAAEGVRNSYPFKIGNDIYSSLVTDASRYYYYQRANLALEEPYAQGFPHGAWHMDDANCPLLSDMSGPKRDVSKGWYDAGDFGKYLNAGATTVSDLLWAYETFPDQFTDNQLNIPESSNGIPDLLDEIRYELEWMLKMQDVDGGFYCRVWPQNAMNNPRYIEDIRDGVTHVKPTSHSASAVAALAHAYIVYKDVDTEFAQQLLDVAVKGWGYLEEHPENIKPVYGPYNDEDDTNDRFWAAAGLYRATGEAKYDEYFKASYLSYEKMFDQPENAHGVGGMEQIAFIDYLNADQPDEAVSDWFAGKFNIWRKAQLDRSSQGVWKNTLEDDDYYWGSNMPVLNTSMVLVLGSKVIGNFNHQIVDTVRANMNYVLGTNPMSYSYVSGYGENSCQRVFSGIYNNDGKDGIPKGYLAGGANMYEGSWFSRFNGKCYVDSPTEWTTNEHTIYWNSGLVFSSALMNSSITQ